MCLIAWNWQPNSAVPLLLVGNRDEFYARPALPMHWWANDDILAGLDLKAGGTWLGLNRRGCLAVLTNHRSASAVRTDAPSRGQLVANFLRASCSAADYLQHLESHADHYNPFNLLLYDGQALLGFESRNARRVPIRAGICAVSNADFNTPWPKLQRLKSGLLALAQPGDPVQTDSALFALLQDRETAPDADLPSSGIALAQERALSAPFVTSPGYGTRACSVVQLGHNRARVNEHSFNANGATGQAHFEFEFFSPAAGGA